MLTILLLTIGSNIINFNHPLKLISALCSYAGKHCPAFEVPDKENKKFPFIWTPPNPRNKAVVFRTIFAVYTNTTYPVSERM